MSLYDGQGSRSLGGAEYDDGSSILGGSGFVEDTAEDGATITVSRSGASLASESVNAAVSQPERTGTVRLTFRF